MTGDSSVEELQSSSAWGDRPIRHGSQDRLGRLPFAAGLADELANPAPSGVVVGVTGPWGAGKTSVLNLVAHELGERAVVIRFNPWLFSGTEALLTQYFRELGRQLGETGRLRSLASDLAEYGEALAPLASMIGLGEAAKAGARILRRASRGPSIEARRLQLERQLGQLDRRMVVLIDDVDRLRPDEVKDIVRLVRLVGDFPHTAYVLAFDRRRVEECLGDGDLERGRAYLEKIVEVTHDLPDIEPRDIARLVIEGLQEVVNRYETAELDEQAWQDIFSFVIRPLLATPRHVRRYLDALPLTFRLVGNEVALEDVLALEAVRVLRPDVFEGLVEVADRLTSTSQDGLGYAAAAARDPAEIAPLLEADPELARSVCRFLFPASRRYFENMHYGSEWLRTWRRSRKVAHPEVFQIYLQRRIPEGLVRASTVERLFEQIGDPISFSSGLTSVPDDQLPEVLDRLLDFREDVPTEAIAGALSPMLACLPRLPPFRDGPFGEEGYFKLMRLVFRLLERIEAPADRTTVVRAAMTDTASLSGKLLLITVAGHREHIGQNLIPAADANTLEAELRELAVVTPIDMLLGEPHLDRIFDLMAESTEGRAAVEAAVENDAVFLRLLRSSESTSHAWSIGSVAVSAQHVLPWEGLERLVQSDRLARRVAEIQSKVVDGTEELEPTDVELLELAARYATGWRPDPFQRRQPPRDSSPISEDDEQPIRAAVEDTVRGDGDNR